MSPAHVASTVRTLYDGKHGVAELLRPPSTFQKIQVDPDETHELPTNVSSFTIVDLMFAAAEAWRFTHTPAGQRVGSPGDWP